MTVNYSATRVGGQIILGSLDVENDTVYDIMKEKNLISVNLIGMPEITLDEFDSLIVDRNGVTEIIIPDYRDGWYPTDKSEFKFPYLTVSTHSKWYTVYLIHEDKTVEFIHSPIDEGNALLSWFDHAISPHYFYLLGKHYNATIPEKAMIAVIERFVEDALGDITRLYDHLPREGDKYEY